MTALTKRRRKRAYRELRTVFTVLLASMCVLLSIGIFEDYKKLTRLSDMMEEQSVVYADQIGDLPWNLTLVNQENPVQKDPAMELTTLSNGQRVDSRIYPDLQAMFDDARAQAVYPIVREGYRTHEEQKKIYRDRIFSYVLEGNGLSRAKKLAESWVAVPGTSEHELGLAIDINADGARSSNDEVYSWLAENAWKYGFILRYPQGKEEVTGIDYEPWHYRYVGKEAAEKIHETGLALEEYVSANR